MTWLAIVFLDHCGSPLEYFSNIVPLSSGLEGYLEQSGKIFPEKKKIRYSDFSPYFVRQFVSYLLFFKKFILSLSLKSRNLNSICLNVDYFMYISWCVISLFSHRFSSFVLRKWLCTTSLGICSVLLIFFCLYYESF